MLKKPSESSVVSKSKISLSSRIILASALLSLALFLRVYKLNHYPPGLSPDAAFTGINAREIIATHRPLVFVTLPWPGEALITNLVALHFFFLGQTAWVIKLTSAVFGFLGVLGTFLLGTRLKSFRVGWWGAFFLATSFWHLYLSRDGDRPVMMSAWLTLALFLLVVASQARRPWLAFSAGVAYGAGWYSYGPFRVTILLIPVFVWFLRPHRDLVFRMVVAFILTTLPLLIFMASRVDVYFERAREVFVFPENLLDFFYRLYISLDLFFPGKTHVNSYGLYHQSMVWAPLTFLAWLGVYGGVRAKRNRRLVLFLLFWLITAVLVAALTNEPPSVTRTEFALPAFFLLAALGLDLVVSSSLTAVLLISGLLFLPVIGWRDLMKVSGTPRTKEMFAVRQVKMAQAVNRIKIPARVYITKVPVPGGYASHFSDGVVIFLVSPRGVRPISPQGLAEREATPPFFLINETPFSGSTEELLKVYPSSQLILRAADGFLGKTELYLVSG